MKVKVHPAAKGKSVLGRVTKALPGVGLAAGAVLYVSQAQAAHREDILFQEMMASMGVTNLPFTHDSLKRSGAVFGGETVGGEIGGGVGGAAGLILGIQTGPGAIATGVIGAFGGGMVGDEVGGRAGGGLYDWLGGRQER